MGRDAMRCDGIRCDAMKHATGGGILVVQADIHVFLGTLLVQESVVREDIHFVQDIIAVNETRFLAQEDLLVIQKDI